MTTQEYMRAYKTIYETSWTDEKYNNYVYKDIEFNVLPSLKYISYGDGYKMVQCRWLIWGVNFKLK